jgi:hypothetical protein
MLKVYVTEEASLAEEERVGTEERRVYRSERVTWQQGEYSMR